MPLRHAAATMLPRRHIDSFTATRYAVDIFIFAITLLMATRHERVTVDARRTSV